MITHWDRNDLIKAGWQQIFVNSKPVWRHPFTSKPVNFWEAVKIQKKRDQSKGQSSEEK